MKRLDYFSPSWRMYWFQDELYGILSPLSHPGIYESRGRELIETIVITLNQDIKNNYNLPHYDH
jgi:hypothetical protein